MGDVDDWEDLLADDAVVAPAGAEDDEETKGERMLREAEEPDMNRFADEEEGGEEEVKYVVPASQPKKPAPPSKYDESRGAAKPELMDGVDDPEAARLRKFRLEQEGDMENVLELFGGGKPLEATVPQSEADFKGYAERVYKQYIAGHSSSKQYKSMVKHLISTMLEPMGLQECRDIAAQVAGIREKKQKVEKDKEAAAKKEKQKPTLKGGGGKKGKFDDLDAFGGAQGFSADAGYELEDDFM